MNAALQSGPSSRPRIGVGMPVYNGERYVEQAIRSLLDQTYSDFELIVSDNASTDRTTEICHRLAAQDARIRFVRSETNLGAAANFQRVLDLSRSEYFKWACADDYCDPTLLERCMGFLEQHPETVLCYGRTIIVDAGGHEIDRHVSTLDLRPTDTYERVRRACQYFGQLNALQGVMRGEAIKATRGFKDFAGSDFIVLLELALRGTCVELSVPLLYRRMHPAAQSTSANAAERAVHLNPQKRRSIVLGMWRIQIEQLKAIVVTPANALMKCRLIAGFFMWTVRRREILARELMQGARQAIDIWATK